MNSSLTLQEWDCEAGHPYGLFNIELALQYATNNGNARQFLGFDGNGSSFKIRDQIIVLCKSGCMVNGQNDCGYACMQDNMIWAANASMTTLQNCLVAPIISAANVSKHLNDALKLMDKYKIKALESLSSITDGKGGAWSNIDQCMQKTSHSPSLVKLTTNYKLGTVVPVMAMHPISCADESPDLNPDLGGRAVIIAFILQLCLLLALWLCTNIFIVWFRPRSNPSTPDPPKSDSSKPTLTVWQAWRNDCQQVLFETAAEFQKTQVFFICSVQIAVLLALFRDTKFDVQLLDSLVANLDLVVNISYLGTTPAVLNLLTLRKSYRLDWFMILLTLLSLAISTTVFIKASKGSISAELISPPADSGQYDYLPSPFWRGFFGFFLPTSWFIFAGLVIERTWYDVQHHSEQSVYVYRSWLKKDNQKTTPAPRWMTFIGHLAGFYLVVINAFLLSLLLLNNLPLTPDGGRSKNFAGVSLDWTFGQVISVGLWIPLAIQWLYWSLFGVNRDAAEVESVAQVCAEKCKQLFGKSPSGGAGTSKAPV